MAVDQRNPGSTDWTRPIRKRVAVTASATPFADGECRAIYLGTAGDITMTGINGESVKLKNMAAGVWHPCACTAITVIDNSAADVFIGY